MRHFFLLQVCTLLGATTAFAQLNLSGIVTDEKDKPLAGVSILILGTNIGTTTQADGRFILQASNLPLTITASSIGYQRRDIPVRGNNFRNVDIKLVAETLLTEEVVTAASRVSEDIQKTSVTVERTDVRQFKQSPAFTPFDGLQNVKGVDLVTQSITSKSINIRGFGSPNNSRFLQLNDGMDNRSPGLGAGFGNIAGIPDLDVASMELVSGASSALYGPDAVQGLLYTNSKNPFTYQGLSVQLKTGVNNVGKANSSPTVFGDIAVRYAKQLGDRFAVKVNFQRFMGTDFIADDYGDRLTRARPNLFYTDRSPGKIRQQ